MWLNIIIISWLIALSCIVYRAFSIVHQLFDDVNNVLKTTMQENDKRRMMVDAENKKMQAFRNRKPKNKKLSS